MTIECQLLIYSFAPFLVSPDDAEVSDALLQFDGNFDQDCYKVCSHVEANDAIQEVAELIIVLSCHNIEREKAIC